MSDSQQGHHDSTDLAAKAVSQYRPEVVAVARFLKQTHGTDFGYAKPPWWRRVLSKSRINRFRILMRRLKNWTSRWLARVPLWGAAICFIILIFTLAICVLLAFEYTNISQLLGIQLSGWNRLLAAAGVVTLSAAIVGLVVSYRKQRDAEDSKNNTEFANAAAQLGADTASVRIAGVYAMAALADRSTNMRQRCIDVLCGHLRLPYDPETGASNVIARTFKDHNQPNRTHTETVQYVPGEREVRFTIIRVIRDHLIPEAKTTWRGHNFDFTGAVFDGGSFDGIHFSEGQVSFQEATFATGQFSFKDAEFNGGNVNFHGAKFNGGNVDFRNAQFNDGNVNFHGAKFIGGNVYFSADFNGANFSFNETEFNGGNVYFSGEVNDGNFNFIRTKFNAGNIDFGAIFNGGSFNFLVAAFNGGTIYFDDAEFNGGSINFHGTEFNGGSINFHGTEFNGSTIKLLGTAFNGATINFHAYFHEGTVDFEDAQFNSGIVDFTNAVLVGSKVDLSQGDFRAGLVDLSNVADWRVAPILPDAIPEGLKLPLPKNN